MPKQISFLTNISRTLSKDPYWNGPGYYVTRHIWQNKYTGQTDAGFNVRYTLKCWVEKIDFEEFRSARMLEEANQRSLVDDWHRQVFLPNFLKARCSFKYLSPWNQFDYGNPCFCRVASEGDEEFIHWDFNCHETNQEFESLPSLKKNGCEVRFFAVEVERDDEQLKDGTVIKENYNMIKVRGLKTPENSEAFREWEETCVIAMLHRRMELEQEFQHIQSTQRYESKQISVVTKLVGKVVELSWKCTSSADCVLRGYRKEEEGFVLDEGNLAANGICVVETQNAEGKAVQNLKVGKEYFYSFLFTRDEPVYAEQAFPQSLVSSPAIKGYQRRTIDTLRFSVRIPTGEELARVDNMLRKLESLGVPAPDPKREKINRAFEELSSFVEFDESLTQWEKQFLSQIEAKNYSPDEKRDKIEKLKSVVESLRIASMP